MQTNSERSQEKKNFHLMPERVDRWRWNDTVYCRQCIPDHSYGSQDTSAANSSLFDIE